jgi:Arc/MetJ family transcription regulator
MYIQTHIDDQLFQQATKLTGLMDKQALLEESLRVLIQTQKKSQPTENFWDALQRFRAEAHLDELDIDTCLFDSDRKQQTEREIEL